jgi:hypothetical protein
MQELACEPNETFRALFLRPVTRSTSRTIRQKFSFGRFAPTPDIAAAAKLPILRCRENQENKCRFNWDFRDIACQAFILMD